MNPKAWIVAATAGWYMWIGSVMGQELPPGTPYDALSSWSFSDTNSWKSDLGYKPLSFTNIHMSDLGDGPAVVVDNLNPAWLRYPVIDMGQTNLVIGSSGSVLFWFAPSWSGTNAGGTGPGAWGRLIEVGSYTTNASVGWWSLYTDPQGCNLFFSAQTNGATAVYLSSPISWETNRWHFVALTYSRTNASLYLDGRFATNASGVAVWPADAVSTNGFCLGSSADGANQAHGIFDSMSTYGYVLSARSISNYFNGTDIDYWGNPMNTANLAKVPYDPPVPAPGFRAIMGSGSVRQIGIAGSCATNASVWMTNVTAKLTNNGTMNLTFKVGGGSPGVAYDVFGSDGLVGNSITNAEWVWLGQAYACSTNVITNLSAGSALFALGTERDSDRDGLTDAFEALVSKTDPNSRDTYGNGAPDWWQVVHFGANIMDPYDDEDGDGWTNWQEFHNSTDPFHFDTPPPPQDVNAILDTNGVEVVVTWRSGGGPVTNYLVQVGPYDERSTSAFSTAGEAAPSIFRLRITLPYPVASIYQDQGIRVVAQFLSGPPAASPRVGVSKHQPYLVDNIQAVRGPDGSNYVVFSGMSPDVKALHFYGGPGADFDFPVSNVTRGVIPMPDDWLWHKVRAMGSNSVFGSEFNIAPVRAQEASMPGAWQGVGFPNAAAHLKENLRFLLRSATVTKAFNCAINSTTEVYSPEMYLARAPSPDAYEYYGFHTFSWNLNYSILQELRPLQEHFLWRNLVYDPDDVNIFDNTWGNGVTYDQTRMIPSPTHSFNQGLTNPIPIAFNANSSEYIYARWTSFVTLDQMATELGRLGIGVFGTDHDSSGMALSNGVRNLYGLPVVDILDLKQGSPEIVTILNPGDAPVTTAGTHHLFLNAAMPSLEISEYYFASEAWYLNVANTGWYGSGPLAGPAPPLPGAPTFSVTNHSPPMFTSIGQPITVSGWAKMAISNGYNGKFAYLEQYFKEARTMTNGAATDASAGLLSPYGEFFPMQPGPAALITLPDVDTGQQGTGVVNVIKLQLDANHDGIMDLSFTGPDNTYQNRPFRFWVNYDADISSNPTNDPGHDELAVGVGDHDCGTTTVNSPRDLEDFARLWIMGVPAFTPGDGYQVTLSWDTVLSGSPEINLVNALDPGIDYLANSAAAIAQAMTDVHGVGPGNKFGFVGQVIPYTFPSDFFTNGAPKYLLFEGRNTGSGALVLKILHNGTNVAETRAWLDLHDIKDFYERAVITNNTSGTISNWTSGLRTTELASSSVLGEDAELIAFIHGINVSDDDWKVEADTVCKRLYWAGYRGKFATVKWPCERFAPAAYTLDTSVFNRSEVKAYKSASALAAYLGQLHTRFPDHRIHLYAHSQGNAVVSEAIKHGGVVFDTYILTQGAVPDSCYDVNAPTNTTLRNADYIYGTPHWQPMGYHGFFTNFTGRIVNFYNPSDPALAIWIADQAAAKPDGAIRDIIFPTVSYTYDGTNGWQHNTLGGSYMVTDSQESRAMISRSLTEPIGRSGPAAAHGVIQSAVDLQAQFDFNAVLPADHSAQWVRPIQVTRPYFQQLLRSCQLIPAP